MNSFVFFPILMAAIIAISIVFLSAKFRERIKRLEGVNDSERINDLQRQVGYLMSENEHLQERLKRLEKGTSNHVEMEEMSLEEIERQKIIDNK